MGLGREQAPFTGLLHQQNKAPRQWHHGAAALVVAQLELLTCILPLPLPSRSWLAPPGRTTQPAPSFHAHGILFFCFCPRSWLAADEHHPGADVPLGSSIVQRLQRFGTYGRLKRAALHAIARFVPPVSLLC